MEKFMEPIDFIDVNKNSRVPMYQQIVDSIINNISNGNIKLNDKLPSINSISEDFYLSRDTVEKAYSILKDRNIIVSIPRRGYYVSKIEATHKLKILFLVNKLSTHKMIIYNSFVNRLGLNSKIDLVIYHCDEFFFLNTLNNNKEGYDYYVIMPHFKTDTQKHASFTEDTLKVINEIPKNKLLVLDNLIPPISEEVSAVYQEFDNDIYEALKKGIEKIHKYNKLILIYPEKSVYPYPRRILRGFRKFCLEKNIDFEILNEVCDDMVFIKGDLFITIEESDLVNLVNQLRENEFKIGQDIGIISYNDTPLKQLLGIAVVSTNFKIMGESAAQMILDNKLENFKVPFNFIDRNSI
ncbi:GntR family transcriptional regulator [Jejuia pallidilutea]|uniref:Transcriptional regulator of rhamnose utilization n=1 Tax=Jejuia pallidilutea TaxID=504487 RepID=A0A090WTU0_9FLAO|nr:GntR family transcriptional regulator [Jejuia pallidilutea]GAL67181.1 transcriptional regulator of rhamnose utilization [Jejuia pallidilutea]GAL70827.1 transcriptional regulator of rhamnose utilization [Jejuia pallidilutea]GAL89807.1 transcriptional regulator of rhamnose utilization [Jejuia pallidilutea]